MNIDPKNIILKPKGKNKYEIIKEIIISSNIDEKFKQIAYIEVEKREKYQSTSVGKGIGIAHGAISDFGNTEIILGILEKGINYDSCDDLPVDIIFVVLFQDGERDRNNYLINLSKISKICRNCSVLEKIRSFKNGKNIEELVKILKEL